MSSIVSECNEFVIFEIFTLANRQGIDNKAATVRCWFRFLQDE